MKIGNREFDFNVNCYVMGVLNVTPDSFYDGGRYDDAQRAVRHVSDMIREGADIIDIGGESTRPGYEQISPEEEISRVLPYIKAIKENFDIPLSVDTYKSEVAKAALDEGADMVNDIWGLRYDGRMAGLIAKYQVPCCLVHNREKAEYKDFIPEMLQDMKITLALAGEAGIGRDKIILDPGIGFGKTRDNDLTVIRELGRLCALGCPVLLGASRKSFIGKTLGLPVEERLEGTLAAAVMGIERGARIIRVHDVKENLRALKMAMAIMGASDER